MGLKPFGISFHVGSQASNMQAWKTALHNIAEPMADLQKAGIQLEVLNIGGGYPCNTYASSEEILPLEEVAKTIYEEYAKLPYQPRLLLEPGRGIVADAGIVIGTVIARIERKEHTWIFLDSGPYNALFESMSYQGSTRYRITSLRKSFEAGESFFALAGPTGDSADVIGREILLPSDIDVGDAVVFHDTGAYCVTAHTPFNGFPKPAVYFI